MTFETIEQNVWSKPITSTYGRHLIKIISIRDERLPKLEEIKPRVIVDLNLQKKDSALSEYIRELKENYEVVISRGLQETYNE